MTAIPLDRRGLRRQFLRYVPLNIMGMLALSCYILADTFFIANGVGADGLTALNLVLPMFSLVSGLGRLFGMGGATKYAICKSAREPEATRRVFTQSMLLCAVTGAAVTVPGVLAAEWICTLLGADASILPLATQYLRTISLFALAFIFNNALVCFVRNDGNPRLAMLDMVIGSLANVVLDYIFIFPLGMGMFGAAIATCFSPLIGIGVLCFHLFSAKSGLKPMRCRPTLRTTAEVCSIGFSSFFTEFSSGIVIILFNFLILSLAGNAGVAAYGIVANLNLFAVAMFSGISEGAQPLVSGAYGAGRYAELRRVYHWAVSLAVVLGIGLYALSAVFAQPITQLFNRDGGAALTQLATQGIHLYFPALFLAGINIVTTSLFASITRPTASFVISVARSLVLVSLFALTLSRPLGMTGVWLSIPCTEVVTLLLTLFFLKRLDWDRLGGTTASPEGDPS